ncbi:DUF6668 family protein [Streptomyces sp. LBL]|uniref:DUF6668 family protein n=1 Tax=Streptomyces sp. LBL TaxID=2940562 RepID=UPI0024731972|nr:DUF6668 family protein [Streptomyces sp. LBL]
MRTDVPLGPEIWLRGPVPTPAPVPVPGPVPAPVPVPVPPEFVHPSATPRRYSFVGVHGGAGTTTLAAVYGGHDCGRDWPGPAAPQSVLLVARTHAAGLHSALHILEAFRRGEAAPPGLDLDAVVLVADAPGRLPRPLAQRIKVIESAIDVYRVPWVPAWRLGDLTGPPPRETGTLTRLTASATATATP